MVIGSTGAWKGPFGYSGSAGYQEDETGLQLLGHRYYDSSTGRFITRDPIKDGRNWYVYCDGNPVNRVDANGLDWIIVSTDDGGNGLGAHARIGTWDGNPNHPIQWWGFYKDGIHRNDAPVTGTPGKDVFIQVTPQQRRQIEKRLLEEYLAKQQGKGQTYEEHTNNCAIFIRKLLLEILFADDPEGWNDIMTPEQLIAWLGSFNPKTLPGLDPKKFPEWKDSPPWRKGPRPPKQGGSSGSRSGGGV
jgi:RHS repeat-associated protein